MNKTFVIGLISIFILGCHCPCRKTTMAEISNGPETVSAVSSDSIAEEEEIIPSDEQTATSPYSAIASQTADDAPASLAKSATPIVSSHSTQMLESQEATDQMQETNIQSQEVPTVQVPQFTPFPFQPTFKGEDTIKTEGRMLNPYAELVPDPSAKQTAPWAYEQLKYGLYYSFVKAGTAYIHNLGLVDIDGRPAYVFQTTAFSASVIDAVFKVRDINQSWLDATDFYAYGYGQSVREGNYVRDEWLKFNYPAKKYEGLIRKKEEPHEISGPLDIEVEDMLSSLYYVRAYDLKVGQDVVFDIINREKQYPLVVKVLKKEKVKVAAGKFNCIVVEPQFRGEGIFISKGKSLKVWLTDDEYRMPVKMKVEVFIGSVSAELLEYQRQAPANIL